MAASQHELPTFVLMQSYGDTLSFFNYGGSKASIPDSVTMDSEKGVFNPLAKIEVEREKSDSSYVHLKFPETKKYFAVVQYKGTSVVVARSDKAEEDKTKPSCTLFMLVRVSKDGEMVMYYNLIHVQSGLQVHKDNTQPPRLVVDSVNHPDNNKFTFVDWDTIMKLPEHVAFKGDNGKYLQAHQQDDLPYLQFSSDDPYCKGCVFHIEQRLDGHVRIKSDSFGKYWKFSSSWILADEDHEGSLDRLDDVFWPTKVNESTIALRSAANNQYCARLHDKDSKTDCLNAAVSTTDRTARMGVEELVSERKITKVMYHMDEAQIIDEKPYAAGEISVENKGDKDASMAVEMAYEDERAVNFSHSFFVTAEATATLSASVSVPFINVPFFKVPSINVDATVHLHTEETKSFEWGHTTTDKQTLKVTGTVTVPGRHMAVVHCVGTQGTCIIPFSYEQVDKSSIDETITRKTYHDGVFTGTNSYNFHFIIDRAIPIE